MLLQALQFGKITIQSRVVEAFENHLNLGTGDFSNIVHVN